MPETIMFSDFRLGDSWFTAMDSADPRHAFGFNEAVSLVVRCADQAEVDRLWQALSAVPEAEQCGWLKDRFGVSWQIVPAAMDTMLSQGTPEQVDRVVQAFMPMHKIDLATLEAAYAG
ncbi:VOC family protein [Nocardioides sp. Iso805N]|uniref:VOC family protein n=1 Tax=Nocardioides sp. Iso805N TaxID=1283287 RepID=UPI00037DBB66|nr:VOC family protein [Nocardioides sp. Iso805N]